MNNPGIQGLIAVLEHSLAPLRGIFPITNRSELNSSSALHTRPLSSPEALIYWACLKQSKEEVNSYLKLPASCITLTIC